MREVGKHWENGNGNKAAKLEELLFPEVFFFPFYIPI